MKSRFQRCAALGVLCLASLTAQQQPPPSQQNAAEALRPTYVLGPNDQVTIRVPGMEELGTTPYRIDDAGDITLPLLGKVKASNLTVEQLEREIAKRLEQYLVNPQVSLSVVQFRSEPIFVVGAFSKPGIQALSGRRTLLDTLISLGGLQPGASRKIRVTRRLDQGKIPLPSAIDNPEDGTSTVEIHLNKLMETVNPAEDIVLEPFDVITATKLEQVFVTGQVNRPGTFDAIEGESISLIQLVSISGGFSPEADPKGIRVLRPITGSQRRAEILVNYEDAVAGRVTDFPILPNDVLYVPKRRSIKPMLTRVSMAAVPAVLTSMLFLLRR